MSVHWVYHAAEAHRALVEALPHGTDSNPHTGRTHLLNMLDRIGGGLMRVEKANRWLGWIQACLCFHGAATLEQLKEINFLHSQQHKERG